MLGTAPISSAVAGAHLGVQAPSISLTTLLLPSQGWHFHMSYAGQPAGSTPWVQSSELTGRPATNLLPFLVLGPQGTTGPAAEGSPFSACCTSPFLDELYLWSSENLTVILRNTLQQSSKGTFCWLVCCSLNQINLIHIESICLLFVSGKT